MVCLSWSFSKAVQGGSRTLLGVSRIDCGVLGRLKDELRGLPSGFTSFSEVAAGIICGGVDPDALLPLAAVKADAGSPATQTFLTELRKCSLPGFQEAFQKSAIGKALPGLIAAPEEEDRPQSPDEASTPEEPKSGAETSATRAIYRPIMVV